ncbi:Protein phosphatase 2C 1 [Pelomyxa schiedti]|nr:Protein phosphatase 2C 1 [Pelomyxa schiedti]
MSTTQADSSSDAGVVVVVKRDVSASPVRGGGGSALQPSSPATNPLRTSVDSPSPRASPSATSSSSDYSSASSVAAAPTSSSTSASASTAPSTTPAVTAATRAATRSGSAPTPGRAGRPRGEAFYNAAPPVLDDDGNIVWVPQSTSSCSRGGFGGGGGGLASSASSAGGSEADGGPASEDSDDEKMLAKLQAFDGPASVPISGFSPLGEDGATTPRVSRVKASSSTSLKNETTSSCTISSSPPLASSGATTSHNVDSSTPGSSAADDKKKKKTGFAGFARFAAFVSSLKHTKKDARGRTLSLSDGETPIGKEKPTKSNSAKKTKPAVVGVSTTASTASTTSSASAEQSSHHASLESPRTADTKANGAHSANMEIDVNKPPDSHCAFLKPTWPSDFYDFDLAFKGKVKPSARFHLAFVDTRGRRGRMEDVVTIIGGYRDVQTDDLIGLYDGHNGPMAAMYIADALDQSIRKALDGAGEDIPLIFNESFLSVNKALLEDLTVIGGSTALVAFLRQDIGYLANVGDSRAIIVNTDKTFERLSVDHRPDDPLEAEYIKQHGGQVTEGIEGGKKVLRVNTQLTLSRAFGDRGLAQFLRCEPHIASFPINDPTRSRWLVMACDGLWDFVPEQEVADIVQQSANPIAAALELRKTALVKSSGDNISIVIVDFLQRHSATMSTGKGPSSSTHIDSVTTTTTSSTASATNVALATTAVAASESNSNVAVLPSVNPVVELLASPDTTTTITTTSNSTEAPATEPTKNS